MKLLFTALMISGCVYAFAQSSVERINEILAGNERHMGSTSSEIQKEYFYIVSGSFGLDRIKVKDISSVTADKDDDTRIWVVTISGKVRQYSFFSSGKDVVKWKGTEYKSKEGRETASETWVAFERGTSEEVVEEFIELLTEAW